MQVGFYKNGKIVQKMNQKKQTAESKVKENQLKTIEILKTLSSLQHYNSS
jgi:hypothetical protein